jgi:prepilin-type processing-associated H-X9-DG protein
MLRKIALSMTIFMLACLRVAAQDRSTPEATVQSFLTELGSAHLKEAAACVKGVKLDAAGLDALAQQVKKDPATLTLSDAKSTITGTTANVTGKVTVKAASQPKSDTFDTDVNLVSADGAWLIVPRPQAELKKGNDDLLNLMAYSFTDPKVFKEANEAARGASCLSNVKQVSLGAMMFVQDWDEVFKLKAETYKKSLMPYIKNASIFTCPSDKAGATSYSFNDNLAGVKLAKVKSPAETVMIYEGKNGKLDFRHQGRAAVGFADGHAKLVDAAAAKKLRWMP